MVTGTFLSVGVLLLWGVGDYLLGKSGVEGDVQLTNVIQSLVGVLAMLPVVVILGFDANVQSLLVTALIAFLSAVAYLAYIKAFSLGAFGVVGIMALNVVP